MCLYFDMCGWLTWDSSPSENSTIPLAIFFVVTVYKGVVSGHLDAKYKS